jgi:hypothetical protein
MWELKLINLETGEFENAPTSHWRLVLEKINMSPAVKDSSLACHGLYLEFVEKVRQERLDILTDISNLETLIAGSAATSVGAAGSSPTAAGSGASSAPATLQFRFDGYEEYQVLLQRLQTSMQREHNMCNMLMYSLAQVVSHLQMAKGMVYSWPYLPDGNTIMDIMHEEAAAAQAAAASGMGRAGSAPAWSAGMPSS